MPPTTTTTNASPMVVQVELQRAPARAAACSAPPSPASSAPSANTPVNSAGLVDAERADHLAVLRGGAHQRAPARAREQQPDQAEHHRADDDQEQVVGGKAAARGSSTEPARPGARGPSSSSGPTATARRP